MKKGLIAILMITSSVAFAGNSLKRQERKLLCEAVDQLMKQESSEAVLDMTKCLKNKKISSELASEGVIVVEGKLVFNAPSRPSYKLDCELAYKGTPEITNIVGGLDVGVNCN